MNIIFTKEQIIRMLDFYYESDIENCSMTTKDWIQVVAESQTNPRFMIEFISDFCQYLGEREISLTDFLKD